MLPLEEDREIVSIEYETGELAPESDDGKDTIVDVRCTDSYGRQFIVEMQMNWTESFMDRVLFNTAKTYGRILEIGQKYEELRTVYSINFVNDIFEKSPEMQDEYYHHYGIANLQHVEKRMHGMEFVFIELPKFKPLNRATRKLHELWLRFLTEINEIIDEAPSELLSDKNISEAVSCTEIAAYSKSELIAYDRRKMFVIDERSRMSDSKKEGRVEGHEEGLEEGLVKGRKEGREEGQKEKTVQVVLSSKEAGLSIDVIAKISKLTVDEVNEILIKI
jgi:predicted transposase/invertase (TIGR01784 family)